MERVRRSASLIGPGCRPSAGRMLPRSIMSEPGTSPADAAHEAPERSAHERSVAALLRQLWLGLSTYRLYPENPNRPGFAAVVERLGAAAGEALGGGPVDLEIRADRFVLDGELLPQDDAVDRLALVCFERRVERLTVVGIPDAADLERLYATLTRPPEDLAEAGGAENVLRESGVASLSLSPIGPGAVEEADHVPEELAEAPRPGRLDADVLASELMVEDLHGTPDDQAMTLLARLRRVVAEEPLDRGPAIDVHAAIHDLMTELPVDVRRSLVEILVDKVSEDPVAGRLIGAMTNAELTRALVDIGSQGRRDPVELARSLSSAGVRQVDIIDLTKALAAGQEDAGTIIAGLEQLGADVGGWREGPAGGSVLEVLSEYLTATRSDDVRSIQSAIAATGEEMRAPQVMAVADYLSLETDMERAGEALGIWSDELRRALGDRDERAVASLLQPVRRVLLGAGEERPALFEEYVRQALTPELVLEVVSAEAAEEQPHLAALLAPFGAAGVDALLDLLADEADRQRRALLLGALRRIVPEHLGPVLARLSDERWYVVRNAVSLLGNARSPAVLTRLVETAHHPSEEVRREVPGALAAAGGAEAAPHLVRLALGADHTVGRQAVSSLGTLVGEEAAAALAEVVRGGSDRTLRLQAMSELAEQPGARTALEGLLIGDRESRLPWRLRRRVRRLLAGSHGARR